jgi:uncharacterized protein
MLIYNQPRCCPTSPQSLTRFGANSTRSGELTRAVIDTNLFISALLLGRGIPYELLVSLRKREFDLVMSDFQIQELHRVLMRPKFIERYAISGEQLLDLHRLIERVAERVTEEQDIVSLPAVRDPHDTPILASAIIGRADYLVTGDNDLLVLAGDPHLGELQIVTAAAFVDILRNT